IMANKNMYKIEDIGLSLLFDNDNEISLFPVTENLQLSFVPLNKNIFNTFELDDLELYFVSNNDNRSNLFTEILDNNGQLITEEDNSLTDSKNEVDDIYDMEKDLYLLTKEKCFLDWDEVKK
ncbi:14938_t:CDS:1, partial [Dentiscutata heterogama]